MALGRCHGLGKLLRQEREKPHLSVTHLSWGTLKANPTWDLALLRRNPLLPTLEQ